MTKLPFIKMHGAGNDFVVFDALAHPLPDGFDFAAAAPPLCRRHFGLGADGVLLLERADKTRDARAAVRMQMWNPDGSEDMCGNGLRCIAFLAHLRGHVAADEFTVQTLAGMRAARVFGDGRVRVAMGEPRFELSAVPMRAPDGWESERAVEYSLPVGAGTVPRATTLSTGTAHTVIFLDEPLAGEKFEQFSPQIENHAWFPERTSIMWTRVEDEHNLRLRIWERGAGETLACGTGACAAAVAAQITGRAQPPIHVHSGGGVLTIEWQEGAEIQMTGPARVVFEGNCETSTL
jgi:diaminopimelate epimerase